MSSENPGTEMDRRAQRHASRTGSTYAAFLRRLCEVSSLDANLAECAAVAVLGALERRIQPEEARQLEAQLPRKLVEFLEASRSGAPGPRRFGKEEFLQTVADDLQMSAEEAEPIVRAVLAGLREHISEGEANDVAAQLPRDLLELWQLEQ